MGEYRLGDLRRFRAFELLRCLTGDRLADRLPDRRADRLGERAEADRLLTDRFAERLGERAEAERLAERFLAGDRDFLRFTHFPATCLPDFLNTKGLLHNIPGGHNGDMGLISIGADMSLLFLQDRIFSHRLFSTRSFSTIP